MDTKRIASDKKNIEVTGQQMYIVLEKMSYACCIAGINFKGQVRSNLYKFEEKYIVFICCKDFFLDSIQKAKIMEFGKVIDKKPMNAELLIHDDALEKLSLLE